MSRDPNTAFYATGATIIPVLALTGALQASLYERYTRAASIQTRAGRHHRRPRLPALLVGLLALVLFLIALTGECEALSALANQTNTATAREAVFWDCIVLLAVALAAVFTEVIVAVRRGQRAE